MSQETSEWWEITSVRSHENMTEREEKKKKKKKEEKNAHVDHWRQVNDTRAFV